MGTVANATRREPWNKRKIVGQKALQVSFFQRSAPS